MITGSSDCIKKSGTPCPTHAKPFDLICYDCLVLLCSRCSPLHRSHHFDHVEDIQESILLSLSNSFQDIKKSHDDENVNPITGSLQSLWRSLTSSVLSFNGLKRSEEEISQFYGELHEFLRLEEHKTKQAVSSDLQFVTSNIESDIAKFKPLLSIFNAVKSAHDHGQNNDKSVSDDSRPVEDDSTSAYQTESIIQSIGNCSNSLAKFIADNEKTLFALDSQSADENSILDSIYMYLRKHKTDSLSAQEEKQLRHRYQVTINQPDVNQVKQAISNTIQVRQVNRDSIVDEKATTTTNTANSSVSIATLTSATEQMQLKLKQKDTFIISADKSGFITKYNIESKSAEKYNLDFNGDNTFNSVVAIGEHVYAFGGSDGFKSKMKRFSVVSNAVDMMSEMPISGERISACYDGHNYIYLLNGNKKSHTEVNRYNIHTRLFDRFAFINNTQEMILTSFFFQDMLYCICRGSNKIIRFNPNNRQRDDLQVEGYEDHHIEDGSAFCSDGQGNVYIYFLTNELKFLRINVISKKAELLNHDVGLGIPYYLSMACNPAHDLIYLMGGREYTNYQYSIKSNTWTKFYAEDPATRYWCGSAIVTI